MRRFRFPALVVWFVFCGTAFAADTLRIASWNITNLASGPDTALRGHERTNEDYEVIAGVIASLDADVIALQEIGSVPGAMRVLGPDYDVWFETRCLVNAAGCMADNDDIYTAIAVRKSLSDGVEVFQIDQLAIEHDDECASPPRKVRGAVGVKLIFDGRTYWIPSVHLKSGCNMGRANSADTEDDCFTLKRQLALLKEWIKGIPESETVIFAGDFNLRFLRVSEPILNDLEPELLFLPPSEERQCWADYHFDFKALQVEARANNPTAFSGDLNPRIYTPKQFGPLDYFIVANADENTSVTSEMIELPNHYDFRDPGPTLEHCDGTAKAFPGSNRVLTFGRANPSDHCPIAMTLSR